MVIFQHGITRNRTDMLAIAGALAQAGFAVVAIDAPLHGMTDKTSPFYRNQLIGSGAPSLVVGERTFDLDLFEQHERRARARTARSTVRATTSST